MSEEPLPIALLLPGQGAQRPGMARGLYGVEATFTAAVDEVLDLLGAEGDRIRDDWAADRPAVPLDHVLRAQPLLFALDYALGRVLLGWGVRPAVLLGHSAGEAAAAVLAGVVSLPDAVRLLAERIALIAEAPPGGMVAVAATREQIAPFLTEQVVVGAVNSRDQLMVAGPDPQLTEVADALRAEGFVCVRAGASSGFHSPSLAEASARQIPSYADVTLRPPAIPIRSGYTARSLTAAEATDPEFWAMQPARPVLFGPALDGLLAERAYQLVETGPGQSLSAPARRHPEVGRGGSRVLALLDGRSRGPGSDRAALLRAAEQLVAHGHVPDPGILPELRAVLAVDGPLAAGSTGVRSRFEARA